MSCVILRKGRGSKYSSFNLHEIILSCIEMCVLESVVIMWHMLVCTN